MLSIEESKKILNKYGANYTDEEVQIIRDYLYFLAELDYQLFMSRKEHILQLKEEKNTIIIPFNKETDEKGNPIYPRIHRRAS